MDPQGNGGYGVEQQGGSVGSDSWFERVVRGEQCDQNWGVPLGHQAPAVFGKAETMEFYCNDKVGRGWGYGGNGIAGACADAGQNVLRIGYWNMCYNVEWMFCVIHGRLPRYGEGGVGNRQIIFTFAPAMINMEGYSDGMYGFEENDIYPLEVCLLNEACANGDEIFNTEVGQPFVCELDVAKWLAAAREIQAAR